MKSQVKCQTVPLYLKAVHPLHIQLERLGRRIPFKSSIQFMSLSLKKTPAILLLPSSFCSPLLSRPFQYHPACVKHFVIFCTKPAVILDGKGREHVLGWSHGDGDDSFYKLPECSRIALMVWRKSKLFLIGKRKKVWCETTVSPWRDTNK